ncbi:hypothetical protein [Halalkalicoccus tibetensis]|uniref:DUF1059 domain-containing protein n=1 Tax=Halalkalicoccus tibetensis TaxID=175632 RepID=A0ABD5V5X2_9EURY
MAAPNDTMDEPNRPSIDASEDSLVGRCERCSWSITADSHSAIVEAYQDHLRERHPEAWLRG